MTNEVPCMTLLKPLKQNTWVYQCKQTENQTMTKHSKAANQFGHFGCSQYSLIKIMADIMRAAFTWLATLSLPPREYRYWWQLA